MGKNSKDAEEATPAAGEDNNKHLAFLVAQEDSAKAHRRRSVAPILPVTRRSRR
jgi:hypothetical protein